MKTAIVMPVVVFCVKTACSELLDTCHFTARCQVSDHSAWIWHFGERSLLWKYWNSL